MAVGGTLRLVAALLTAPLAFQARGAAVGAPSAVGVQPALDDPVVEGVGARRRVVDHLLELRVLCRCEGSSGYGAASIPPPPASSAGATSMPTLRRRRPSARCTCPGVTSPAPSQRPTAFGCGPASRPSARRDEAGRPRTLRLRGVVPTPPGWPAIRTGCTRVRDHRLVGGVRSSGGASSSSARGRCRPGAASTPRPRRRGSRITSGRRRRCGSSG